MALTVKELDESTRFLYSATVELFEDLGCDHTTPVVWLLPCLVETHRPNSPSPLIQPCMSAS